MPIKKIVTIFNLKNVFMKNLEIIQILEALQAMGWAAIFGFVIWKVITYLADELKKKEKQLKTSAEDIVTTLKNQITASNIDREVMIKAITENSYSISRLETVIEKLITSKGG